MSDRKRAITLTNLERALTRLEEALAVSPDAPLAIDGTIQRFEFAIELTWKSIKRVLMDEGIETSTPREAIKAAFQAHWIDDEALWLSMLKDRNATSHIYDEATARKIYDRIADYQPVMARLLKTLRARPGFD